MEGLRERLQRLVDVAGSARELSRRAGLTEVHVGQILRRLAADENANIERKTLRAIARAGDVAEAWLLYGDKGESIADADARHVAHDAAVSMRPELRNHPLWPELEAGARAKAAEMGRTFPEWAWDATARARLVITGDPDVTGVFDLVKMHFERGWGRPRDERAETGAVPKAKTEKP